MVITGNLQPRLSISFVLFDMRAQLMNYLQPVKHVTEPQLLLFSHDKIFYHYHQYRVSFS